MSLCLLSYLGGVLDRASAISCGSDAVTCLVTGQIIRLYCVAWLTQESVSSRIFVEPDAFRKVQKGENLPVVKLLPGSHERLAFEEPTRSVPETWGRMYDVLALRNYLVAISRKY